MNREIKFRAFKNDKIYRVDSLDIHPDGTNIHFSHQEGSCERLDGCPIMQFTGLKDKNRTEIYEGDIVGVHKIGGGVCRTGVVEFDKGKFVNTYRGTAFKDELGIYGVMQSIEVIGNIYQHPHLLAVPNQ